jgi:hypothetical protein
MNVDLQPILVTSKKPSLTNNSSPRLTQPVFQTRRSKGFTLSAPSLIYVSVLVVSFLLILYFFAVSNVSIRSSSSSTQLKLAQLFGDLDCDPSHQNCDVNARSNHTQHKNLRDSSSKLSEIDLENSSIDESPESDVVSEIDEVEEEGEYEEEEGEEEEYEEELEGEEESVQSAPSSSEPPSGLFFQIPSPEPSPPPEDLKEKPENFSVFLQRPIKNEMNISSHMTQFQQLSVTSMNPPTPLEMMSSISKRELARRLTIGICLGIHSGNVDVKVDPNGIEGLMLFKTLISTFVPVAQPHFNYRFYFAFDHNDRVYEDETNRREISDRILQLVKQENEKRPHPSDYKLREGNVQASDLHVSVHWVHCNYNGKPSWAHNDAAIAAFKEGADYVYRTNDDSMFPERVDWLDVFIHDLRSRAIPNLGVVGPYHPHPSHILTHDFVHATHVAMFGYYYPRSLPDWSSDDWITFVYEQLSLKTMLDDVRAVHVLNDMRYSPTDGMTRYLALRSGVEEGMHIIRSFIDKYYPGAPVNVKPITLPCC